MADPGVEHEEAVEFVQARAVGIGLRGGKGIAHQFDPLRADLLSRASVAIVEHRLGKRVRLPRGAGEHLRGDRHPAGGNDLVIARQRGQMPLEISAVVRRQVIGKRVILSRLRRRAQIKGPDAGRRQLVGTLARKIDSQGQDSPLGLSRSGRRQHQREADA